MWWVGSNAWDIYLGNRAFMAGRDGLCTHFVPVTDLRQSLDELRGWASKLPIKTGARIWLAGSQSRPFLCSAVAGVQGDDELLRVATAMVPDKTGLNEPCKVRIERRSDGSDNFVVATSESLIEELRNVAASSKGRLRVRSIRPWWAEVLRFALLRVPELSTLAVLDTDALIVLAGAGPSFTLATAVTPFANPAEIQATLSRMFFLGGLEPDNCLQLWLNCEVASGSKAPSAHAGQKSGSYTFAFSQCTESNL